MSVKRWAFGLWFAVAAAAPGLAAEAEVMNLEEAAAFLRLTPEAVKALAERQRIPARRIGEAWRFSRPALLEWLKGDELASIRGRQAAPAAPPATVGERRTAPTAEEIALRDQGVLLKRRATTLDLGLSYARSEQAPVPGVRTEQRTIGATAALRYGLLDDLQVTVRLPYVWRRTSAFADAGIAGTTAPSATRDNFTGDASASLLSVLSRERAGRPNVIASIDAVLPTGPGDKGLGGGIVLSKSYDPAVLFAGLSYLHGMDVDAADSRRSLAKHNLGLTLGYTYALNDSLALNTVFTGTYRNVRSPDGVSIRPPRERYQLQLGTTWLLARGLFLEPAVGMRLGGEAPDLSFSLNIPYSF
jgi:excisionase family DNA binding protein